MKVNIMNFQVVILLQGSHQICIYIDNRNSSFCLKPPKTTEEPLKTVETLKVY